MTGMHESGLVGRIWNMLDTTGAPSDGLTKLLVPEVTSCRVFAARARDTSMEALVLDQLDIPRSEIGELPAGAGFLVDVEGPPGKVTRMILRLIDREYQDLFRHLCEDIASRLVAAHDGAHASSILVERLARWQAFFRRAGRSGSTARSRPFPRGSELRPR